MSKKLSRKSHASLRARIHKYVKLALVPHKANQYRPHAVRRYGLVIVVALVIVGQGLYNGIADGNVLGAEAQITTTGLLSATNQARADQDEAPLKINQQLSNAAELKVKDMFAKQYWEHTAPDGTAPWYWFGQVDYTYAEAGENLAKNFATSDTTIAAWLASPTHRANVLKKDYVDVGFAVMTGTLKGKPATIIVAMYGAPEASAVQGVTASTVAPETNVPLSMMTRIGLGLQSLTPAAVSSLVVLILAANVALLAHLYRTKLPLQLRRSWYRHHGMYKATGLVSMAVTIVLVYGGAGQI